MDIKRDEIQNRERREIARYRPTTKLASTPEEAVFRNLFPGKSYDKRTDEQIDQVQKWIEENSPGWNFKD